MRLGVCSHNSRYCNLHAISRLDLEQIVFKFKQLFPLSFHLFQEYFVNQSYPWLSDHTIPVSCSDCIMEILFR